MAYCNFDYHVKLISSTLNHSSFGMRSWLLIVGPGISGDDNVPLRSSDVSTWVSRKSESRVPHRQGVQVSPVEKRADGQNYVLSFMRWPTVLVIFRSKCSNFHGLRMKLEITTSYLIGSM